MGSKEKKFATDKKTLLFQQITGIVTLARKNLDDYWQVKCMILQKLAKEMYVFVDRSCVYNGKSFFIFMQSIYTEKRLFNKLFIISMLPRFQKPKIATATIRKSCYISCQSQQRICHEAELFKFLQASRGSFNFWCIYEKAKPLLTLPC